MNADDNILREEIPVVQPLSQQQPRLKRRDQGSVVLTERDEATLRWIGEQYAIRLDHLQFLLGRSSGRGAQYHNWIGEGAARDVVTRWKKAGWIALEKIRAKQPFWVWLTPKGLRKIGLPYKYVAVSETALDRLDHLYAINSVRLDLETTEENPRWVCERQLAMGVQRTKGKGVLHRPDGEIVQHDELIAIEVELSMKTLHEQEEILLELLRGEEYLRLKEEVGRAARTTGMPYQGRYAAVWYFAAPKAVKRVLSARASLLRQGVFDEDDARSIHLYAYPLAEDTDEEEVLNEQWLNEIL